jgi:hypothetical protein
MFSNVIVYGEKLYERDGYLNNAIKKVFEYLKYETKLIYPKVSKKLLNYSDNNLYVINTEKNNEHIKYNENNFYILIKYDSNYFDTSKTNIILVEEYSSDINYDSYDKLSKYIYKKGNIFVMPWGSELLPYEILEKLKEFKNIEERKNLLYSTRNINSDERKVYNQVMTYNTILYKHMLSEEKEYNLLKNQKLSIVFSDNTTKIDHRVLTHITYGVNCITNSTETQNMLSYLCYVENGENLIENINVFLSTYKKYHIYEMIEYILNNHTVYHRIKLLLEYIKLLL